MSIFSIVLLVFGISQVYWAWRGYSWAAKRIPSGPLRFAVCAAVLVVYTILFMFNLGPWRQRGTPVHLTLHDALLVAPFLWWMASSFFAFLLVILMTIPKGIVAGVRR